MGDTGYWLSKSYNDNRTIRLLVNLLPKGSLIDKNISAYYNKEVERRLKDFFDELERGNIQLTEDVIQSDEFIHKYFITLKAATETMRKEKIEMFARLLKNHQSSLLNANTDSYEDYLKILDDLTYQEIILLTELKRRELIIANNRTEVDYKTRYFHGKTIYRPFREDMSRVLGISEEEFRSLLIRLERTGCITHIKVAIVSEPGSSAVFTTDIYHKLEQVAINM